MELAYYILFFLCAFALVITGAQKDSRRVDALWFLLLVGFSIVVRRVAQSDIVEYYNYFRNPLEDVLHSAQIREVSFWGVSSLLYSLFKSERLVFLVWDAFVFLIILSVRRRLRWGWYFVPFFFVVFSSVLGFQNVYRQFLATVLLINAVSYCLAVEKQRHWVLKCVFFLLFAGTVHWGTAALFPLVIFFVLSGRGWVVANWLLVFIGFIMLPFFLRVEEISNSGLDLTWMYCSFLLLLLSLLVVLSRSNGMSTSSNGGYRFVFLYASYVAIVGFVRLRGDLFYERLMLFFIPMVLVLILDQIHKKSKFTRRVLLLFILFLFSLPSFLFRATYAMMCNE